MSWVTMPIAARRLSCVTADDVLAVDQDASALEVVEAKEQVDQRRLAGAGAADEPDLLARRDRQRQALDDAALAAVVEMDVLEADRAFGHH